MMEIVRVRPQPVRRLFSVAVIQEAASLRKLTDGLRKHLGLMQSFP